MSLIKEKRGKEQYYTFQMGARRKLYLGAEKTPIPERVRTAIGYVNDKIEHYTRVLHELEILLDKERHHRREEIQVITTKLTSNEIEAVVKFSLAENGLSPYELERRGISSPQIPDTITKLSQLGIIEKNSETRTKAGRKLVRYRATPIGAELAMESLRKASEGGLKEEKLRQMAEGDFDATPLGTLYKQMQAVKVRSGTTS